MVKKTTVLDLPVEFGGVSIGDATCRLGVRIDRGSLDLLKADEVFCGHRLTGSVVLGGKDDQSGQGKLIKDMQHKVEGHFDVKRIGVTVEQITTGLTFSLADVDVAELAKFSKGAGRLVVVNVGAIPDDSPAHVDDAEEGRPDAAGSLKADANWKKFPIADLFKKQPAMVKKLHEAKIVTVGDLAAFTSKEHNQLTDLPGIGPGAAEKIERRMEDFWSDNPQE